MRASAEAPLFPNLLGRIFGCPLLIDPLKAETIVGALAPRLGLAAPDITVSVPGEIAARTPYAMTDSGVAVISVLGTLVHRAATAAPPSGLTSYAELSDELAAALADPSVRGILLDVDSFGGEVSSVFDLADMIFEARAAKPIWAAVDDNALSAGYVLASAAERVLVSRTSNTGSIGVIAMHLDVSDREKAEGLRWTTVFAGERKNDFSPHKRLSSEAREILEARIDEAYALFANTVARNRGLTAAAVTGTEAAVYHGGNAIEAGLADALMPFGETLAAFTERLDRPTQTILIGAASAARPGAAASPTGNGEEKPMPDAKTPTPAAAPAASAEPTQAAAPAANPPATAKPAAPASVVNLDAVRSQAEADAAARVTAISQLCAIAGAPDKIAGFVESGATEAQVREALQEARAQADALPSSPAHGGVAATAQPTINAAEIYARRDEQAKAAARGLPAAS